MPEAIPLVDATDIIRLVGAATFERAREYVRENRVVDTSYDADKRLAIGHVLGSDVQPYEATARLTQTHGQYSRPVLTTCTCPIRTDCKHVAAMLLFANQAHAQALLGAPSSLTEGGGDEGDGDGDETVAEPASQGARSPRPTARSTTAAPAASWRQQLDVLSSPAPLPSARLTPMGLQFELRERTRERSGRWGAPTGRPATEATTRRAETAAQGADDEHSSPYRLGVRPVTQSATGNWVRGSLTWTSLPYSLNRLGASPEQHRWFGQFQALHRSARDVYLPGSEADWLFLDDFGSPLLWPLLDEGRRLGIALVTGKREVDVTVAQEAGVTIAVSPGSAGGLRLDVEGVVGGVSHPAFHTGLVGEHGLYAWSFTPGLQVALGPASLGDEARRLLGSPSIDVPEGERDEFFREWFPRLAGAVPVVSRDSSVELPEILPPVLRLTATFGEGDVLTLAWSWDDNGTSKPLGAFPVPDDVEVVNATLKGLGAAEFAAEVLPLLEARNDIRVEIVGARPEYRELTETPHLTVTTVETDKRDWFDLGVMVTVEGRTIPFTPLFTALSRRQDKMLLVDKTYLSLKQPVFDELRRLISEAEELDEWETGELHINRYQASLWAELEELADHTEQDSRWRATVGALADVDGVPPVPVPASVSATLRPYQAEGFSWLAFLYEHELGGVLADDMGLGKTLQTLALVAHSRSTTSLPFLVVAPTSVVGNWVSEAARFTPGLRVHEVTATAAKSRLDLAVLVASGVDVVVTSYALFRLDFARYASVEWAGLVLDEAQMIKNRTSKAHRAAVELKAPFKLAITGTPMENDLFDLWSLFHVTAPGLLMTGLRFMEEYAKPVSLGDRPDLLARLRRRIRPLMLRRTKELVAPDLPEKQEQTIMVDLAPKHRKLYDLFLQRERQKLLGLVDDLDRNRFIVFRSLTLLRMLALDATLVDGEAYEGMPSSKLDVLIDELQDVIAGSHRALVFSQFTSYLSVVASRLSAEGIDYEYLDGSTLKRSDVVARFRDGTAPVFLISLKAGGFGLNLTEADYVFLLDPWWNPATEAQAVDRTHRIGQTSNVMVYRMIARGTIEEKVMELKEAKAKLFDAVMHDNDAAFGAALTADDIRGLLGP
ncbi:DEAD/DEAH box helicase [Frondihabitans australicus]|uniref:SNF2 family DNA or RNA helicase n=1 Tax=Frondihabitans australicus TaxID=386892 RepID=A0A495IH65_9MICO|nr:DEAD/DEAH box helicase [Frondihabitans australicus]RKR74416.1 SNF2 family DNA or RNA helicase [Frondihabitans australicus]